jgi:hypothetical protein
MQMYCTFFLFGNQHFPGLPASGTHCRLFENAACSVKITERIICDEFEV